MVVVDSSALIPLAWVGRLDLVSAVFDDVATTELVVDEVLVEGKRGTAARERFLDGVEIHDSPAESKRVAELEGVAVADASVVLLAEAGDVRLLANDQGLIEVARSHGIDCWRVMTLLLNCAKDEVADADEAKDVLYDLVGAGMNLSPQVYVRVQRKLDEVGV
jgi:predicted nucleic acid-binding protein